jgi:hypothetical protein
MCTVLPPPGVNPIAVNKYVIYSFGTRKIAYVNVGMNSLVSKVILSAEHLVFLAACLDVIK